jgi:hypothetical protein
MGEPTEVKQKQIMLSVEECEIIFCSSKNAPFISKYRLSLTFSKLSFHLLDGFLNLNKFLANKIPLPLMGDRNLGFSNF